MEEKILIVAATALEVAATLTHFGGTGSALLTTPNFDILITGVGMTATAFALGFHLNGEKYTTVINVGIAGSFSTNHPLGSLVSIQQDCFSELGAEDHDNFLTIDKLGFGTNKVSATTEIENFEKVNAITVNTVHGSAESIKLAESRFHAQVESMEGASVFYACQQLQIPCAQIRSISNYVTPRNKADWKIELAVENLNNWLIGFLQSINEIKSI